MALLTHFPFFACSAELLLNLHQPSFCSSFLATSTLKLGGWAEFSSFSWAQGEHAGNLPHFCLLALCNHLETPILCASTTMCMLDSNVLSADVLNANTSFSLPSILSMPTPSFYFLHIVCLYSLILCQPLMACNVLQLYTSTLVSCVLWGFQLGILSFGVFSTRSLVAQVLLPVFWCSGSCLCMWNLISCFLLQAWCLKGWGDSPLEFSLFFLSTNGFAHFSTGIHHSTVYLCIARVLISSVHPGTSDSIHHVHPRAARYVSIALISFLIHVKVSFVSFVCTWSLVSYVHDNHHAACPFICVCYIQCWYAPWKNILFVL